MSSDKNYQGTDVNLETSLEEYGFVARPITVDYDDEYFVIYKMDDNQYGSGHIRESELDAIVNGTEWASEEDVNSMLETVGATKEEWFDLPFTSKFSDLVSYWGTENIMGTDYYPNDKKWAFEEIGLESDSDDLDDLVDYVVPSHYAYALVNGDYSGLSDEEEQELNEFTETVIERTGNANFIISDNDEGEYFTPANDINNLGSTVRKVYIRPSDSFANGGESKIPTSRIQKKLIGKTILYNDSKEYVISDVKYAKNGATTLWDYSLYFEDEPNMVIILSQSEMYHLYKIGQVTLNYMAEGSELRIKSIYQKTNDKINKIFKEIRTGFSEKELNEIIKNAKSQSNRDGYDYIIYSKNKELSFARKSEFDRFFDNNELRRIAIVRPNKKVDKFNYDEYAKGGGVKLPKDAKIRINWVDVSVYKDSYEEGETDNVNNYDMVGIKGSVVSPKELIGFLAKNIYTSEEISDYVLIDNNIHTSVLQDADGMEASESEKEEWKKGNLELFSANYVINVSVISEIDADAETLSSLTGIGVYKKGGKVGKYAKGGDVDNMSYENIYEVLKDKIDNSIDDLDRRYEQSYDFKGEEVEHKFRDGFIPYTNGGYEAGWFEYVSMMNSAGYSLPTEKLQAEMQRHIDYAYELAKDSFKESYPEIVDVVGEENIDYNSLYDAGFTDEAEQLSEWESENMYDEDSIHCSISAYYYEPSNDRGQDGKHTIALQGVINLEAPYHRKGKNDDFTEIIFTFDSIQELKSKLEDGLKNVIDWFNGSKPTGSDDDSFAKGGNVDEIVVKSGNNGKLKVVFKGVKNQKNELQSNEVFEKEKSKGKSVFLFVNDELYDEFIADEDEDEYAKGGGVDEIKNYNNEDELIEDALNYINKELSVNLNRDDFEKYMNFEDKVDFYKTKNNNPETFKKVQDVIQKAGKKLGANFDGKDSLELEVQKKYFNVGSKMSVFMNVAHFTGRGNNRSTQNFFVFPKYFNKYKEVVGGLRFADGGGVDAILKNYDNENDLINDALQYLNNEFSVNFNINDFELYESNRNADVYRTKNTQDIKSKVKKVILIGGRDAGGWNFKSYDGFELSINKNYLYGDSKMSAMIFMANFDENTINTQSILTFPKYKGSLGEIRGGLSFSRDGKRVYGYAKGGSVFSDMTEKEFLKEYFGVNTFTSNPSEYFDIKKLSSSNDSKIENFISELKRDGYSVKKKSYSDFTSVMGVKKKDSFANGGGVDDADWIEESLIDLQNEVDMDDLVVENSNNNHYTASNGNAEFEVFETEYDARERAIERVKEDLEENPEYFNRTWIMNYIDGNDFFTDVYNEWNYGYVNDIENEGSDEYSNRLIEEMVENGIISSEEAKEEDFDAEDYKDSFVELMTNNQIEEGNNGLDYYISEFGMENAFKVILDNNLIDIDKASEDAVDTDGIAHFLSSYDGEQIDLSNGHVAFRTN